MSKHAKWNLSWMAIMAFALVIPFQNCAPSATGEAGISRQAGGNLAASAGGVGLPVSEIDNVNRTTALSFAAASYSAPESANSIAMLGACDPEQDGATLRWALIDPASGQEVASDYMPCAQGAFVVDVPTAALPACGSAMQVKAQLGAGHPGLATVEKSCGG